METELQTSYRGFEPSEKLQHLVQQRAADLGRFYDKITRCQVVISQPDRTHQKGGHFDVRIHLGVPGDELIVDSTPGRHERHTHAEPAARDAFDAMEKQLTKWLEKVRGKTKQHTANPDGVVVRLFPYEGHGFIKRPDGTEVYLHRNSVVDGDFDRLEEGARVRFAEEQGVKGPQASTVHVL